MAAPALARKTRTCARTQSVDALRGAIVMLMATDNIRDYVARSAMQRMPADLTPTNARHFPHAFGSPTSACSSLCSPLASALFLMTRGRHSRPQLFWFLSAAAYASSC